MKAVYFLGAGASKNFGFPLTYEIMPQILSGLKAGNLFNHSAANVVHAADEQARLLQYFYMLYPGLATVNETQEPERIPNITEVLSLVDHCCLYNIPPHPTLSDTELRNFNLLLNRAIGELMLAYEEKEYTTDERKLLNLFIAPMRQKRNEDDSLTFITTNYDLIVDNEIQNEHLIDKVNYGITYRSVFDNSITQPPAFGLLNYYKLHGSLNWLYCSLCGHYYINPYGCIINQAFKEETDANNTCICSDSLRLKPVLVSPSLVRDIRDANLLQVWRGAMESIRVADKLVFVGYSLPAEDLAIKSVIMRGLNGRNAKQPLEVAVVQKGDAAKNNYLNLFNQQVHYYPKGLQQYLQSNKML